MASRLARLRKARGMTQQDVADALNTTTSEVSKLERGKRRVTRDWATKLGRVLHVPASEIMNEGSPTVPVVGYIGAGALWHPIDDHAKGQGIREVICPRGLDPERFVAAEVRGDSQLPIEDGWLVFYSRDPEHDATAVVGKLCVVQITDGACLLKTIRRGPTKGRFNLLSTNAPMVEDVQLEWAAPVRAILPPDLVRAGDAVSSEDVGAAA